MPKFVILGSCKHEPYTILAMPNRLDAELYEKDHEGAYEEACRLFYPAIDHADVVFVWGPEQLGSHTVEDMYYAKKQGKRIIMITPEDVFDWNEDYRSGKKEGTV